MQKTISHLYRNKKYYSTGRIPTESQIVIAGAGIIGNSIAYHLVQNGWRDVLVLEQNRIGSGSSSYGTGIIGLFKSIEMRTMIQYSLKLYEQLEAMGYDIDLKQCGSLNLATTADRLIWLKRRAANTRPTGLNCQLLDRKDVNRMHPFLNVDEAPRPITGALWVAEDSTANPMAISLALAKLARLGGAQFREQCGIRTVETDRKLVRAVHTEQGNVIKCEYFVNCTGLWARELGLKSDRSVCIPAYPSDHLYIHTDGLRLTKRPELSDGMILPIVRDYDSRMYARQAGDEMIFGWFDSSIDSDYSRLPREWIERHQLSDIDTLRAFKPLWQRACDRVNLLNQMKVTKILNAPDNFTPDGKWILGESAEIKNYFVACGTNGNALQGAGGIGKAIAEWLIEGRPGESLERFGVQRFMDLHNNRQYLKQRTKEIVQRHFDIIYPHQSEYKYSRKLRCSPLYSVLESRGAVFGIKMAYERALYFDSTRTGRPAPQTGSFFKPKFFDFMCQEYAACREGVGIIDMSSFSKMEIKGNCEETVLNYLQKMCSNDVNVPVGGLSRTGMQNEQGGYENDCILVRQSIDTFFMVSPSNQQTRIFQWMSRHLPRTDSVSLTDVTSMYTVINVVGPKAAVLMSELSDSSITLSPFTYVRANIGYVSDCMVMSFTHTGEPGYCLYVPSEYALHIYHQLMLLGQDYGVRDVGTLTQRFMRIEKFIPFWGEELTSYVTPYEAGYNHQVKLDKEYFIGKFALLQQKEHGVQKRLVMFHVNSFDLDKDVWAWGGETIYRNGIFCGHVTSAGYGFAAGKLICLGFVRLIEPRSGDKLTDQYILDRSATYEIDIAGKRFPLEPHLRAATNQPRTMADHQRMQDSKYRPTVVRPKNVLK